MASGAARRRPRIACPALAASALDRLPADVRPDRDRCGDRDRPVHRLAGPGADLQDRTTRDPTAPSRADETRRIRLRPAGVPRRRARSRIAAAGHAEPRAADLAGDAGLTVHVYFHG